jgi:hypothetical protein
VWPHITFNGEYEGFPAKNLAAGKSSFLCLTQAIAASPQVFEAAFSTEGLLTLWPGITGQGVVALASSALGPGALAVFLQTFGQSGVSAPVAQVRTATSAIRCIAVLNTPSQVADVWGT